VIKEEMQRYLTNLVAREGALSPQDVADFNAEMGKFSNAFVINMKAKPERLVESSNTLRRVSMPFKHFVAINGKQVLESQASNGVQDGIDIQSKFDVLRPGELGCLLSHLSIINLASQHPNPEAFTIIFEDDIVTSATSVQDTFARIEKVDRTEGVDMVYLGKCLEKCSQMTRIEDNVWRAVAPSCCHAYAVKNGFAKRLMNDLDTCESGAPNCEYYNRGIDSILGDYNINHMVNGLVIHPALFYQDVLTTTSDLRPEFLHNYLECRDTVGSPAPQPQPFSITTSDTVGKNDGNAMLVTAIVILIVIILLYCSVGAPRALIVVVLLAVLIYAIMMVIFLKNNLRSTDTSSKIDAISTKPITVETFQAPALAGPSISKSFEFDTRNVSTKEYDVFNPNAIIKDGKMLTTFRVSNGKVSYPLLEVRDGDMNVINSKRILIQSRYKPIDLHMPLGYEDMRIFQHAGHVGLIGVNLDRNMDKLPAMVMVMLDENLEPQQPVHLHYPPIKSQPNKNWAPISLPDGDLGFVVTLDPLLIVKQVGSVGVKEIKNVKDAEQVKGIRNVKDAEQVNENKEVSQDGLCEVFIHNPKKLNVPPLRNSSITVRCEDIPQAYRDALSIGESTGYYMMLSHTKYVESDFKKDGKLVMYQHYFTLINLNLGKVILSKPFHIEESDRPHIEYVSGFVFTPGGELIVMYGLKDKEAKYFHVSPENLRLFMRN
jgi:hypothetical protein